MELKTIMSQEVAAVLEEATGIVTNRLVMESLLKNGKVTIEEATFLNKLASEVITESAEDFIPDTIEVPDAQPVMEESAQEQAPTIEEATQEAQEAQEAQAQETITESEAIVNNLINKLF